MLTVENGIHYRTNKQDKSNSQSGQWVPLVRTNNKTCVWMVLYVNIYIYIYIYTCVDADATLGDGTNPHRDDLHNQS